MCTATSPEQGLRPINPRQLGTHSPSLLLLQAVIVSSALVDLPTRWTFGPISLLGILTVLTMVAALLVVVRRPVTAGLPWSAIKPFGAFLVWAGVSTLWSSPTSKGIQNLTVVAGFVSLVFISGQVSNRSSRQAWRVCRFLSWSVWVASALYMLGLADDVLSWSVPISLGARSFPLFALIPLAWYVAAWRNGCKGAFPIALGITALILTSLARVALIVGLGSFALARLQSRTGIRWKRLGSSGFLIASILYILVFHYPPLRSRFFEYDASLHIGDVAINVMGRGTMWRATWESFRESPWIGRGAGSSSNVTLVAATGMEHPHNDYLRVLHDYGIVGFALWLIGIGRLILILWKNWNRTAQQRQKSSQIHLAAFLAVVAFSVTMITDNTMAYAFVMFPLGILLGCSFGAVKRYLPITPLQVDPANES